VWIKNEWQQNSVNTVSHIMKTQKKCLLLHEWNWIAATFISLSTLLNDINWHNYTANRTRVHEWMEHGTQLKWQQGETEVLGQKCPSATLQIINPKWSWVGLRPGLCSKRVATNCQCTYNVHCNIQCTYNITLQHIHVTIVAMETQWCNVCNDEVRHRQQYNIKCCTEMFLWQTDDTRSTKMYLGQHETHPVFLSNFNQNFWYSTYFHRSPPYQISWKSMWWGPIWGTTKLREVLCNYANPPKKRNPTQNVHHI
jgi:hypothetical protein